VSAPITLYDFVLRKRVGYINREKLATLKRVFDTVCAEAAIPTDAPHERIELAESLLTASATISVTIEYEPLLLAVARRAVADYRWRQISDTEKG
jgi:hypothetical protein